MEKTKNLPSTYVQYVKSEYQFLPDDVFVPIRYPLVVKELDGLYGINKNGIVYNFKYKRILIPKTINRYVQLKYGYKGSNFYQFKISDLLSEIFLLKINKDFILVHNNGDLTNNKLTNLSFKDKNDVHKIYSGVIYLRTSPSGKYYIGQTLDELKRNQDWFNLKASYAGSRIDGARKKYGPKNFKYEVLYSIQNEEKWVVTELLNEKEKYYISKYNSADRNCGYNMTSGGNGNLPPEFTLYKYKGVNIVQLNIVGDLIKTWKDIYEASKDFNIRSDKILSCCQNRVRTCKGFVWMIKSNYDKYSKEEIKEMILNNINVNIYGIVQLDLDGNFVRYWDSIAQAEKELKIFGITNVCGNKPGHLTCGGFR